MTFLQVVLEATVLLILLLNFLCNSNTTLKFLMRMIFEEQMRDTNIFFQKEMKCKFLSQMATVRIFLIIKHSMEIRFVT